MVKVKFLRCHIDKLNLIEQGLTAEKSWKTSYRYVIFSTEKLEMPSLKKEFFG
jgi:hypothetical protein